MPLRSTSPVPDTETAQNAKPPHTPPSITPVVNTDDSSERQLVVTRAGRVSQPNQCYQDYVST